MRMTFLFFALLCASAAVAQTQVPNVFQAGDPAMADEVNANFSTLEDAVNQNATSITTTDAAVTQNTASISTIDDGLSQNTTAITDNFNFIANNEAQIQDNANSIGFNQGLIFQVMDSSGIKVFHQGGELGRFMAVTDSNTQAAQTIWVISNAGYVTNVNMETGDMIESTVYYSSNNCTGQPYLQSDDADRWAVVAGVVVRMKGPGAAIAYYTPRGSAPSPATFYASRHDGTCTNAANTAVLYQALPNDPNVTGFSSTSPTGPLTLGVQ